MAKYTDILNKHSNLSPSILTKTVFVNENIVPLSKLLSRKLEKSDNGFDIGRSAFLTSSTHFFLKTKALKNDSFIEVINDESAVPMNRKYFVDYNLKEGDILISKDSNIGETIYISEDMPNYMFSGAIYKLPVREQDKLYILAFMKSKYFFQQLDEMVPKGATIRHAGKKFLDCNIVFPNYSSSDDNEGLKEIVSTLVRSIIDKEALIKKKTDEIYRIILDEIKKDQEESDKNNHKVHFSEILKIKRLDASYYCPEAKIQKQLLRNYKYGYSTIEELGYTMKRGQNLQISNIGLSVYSDTPKKNFYTVIKPTNFSEFGTVSSYEYLGNKNSLQTLKEGDIVVSAEGTIGKCVMFSGVEEKWITNIHGIVLQKDDPNPRLSAFVSSVMRFFKWWGYFENFSVGGQGGSLGKKYWDEIIIPNFPDELIDKISLIYHNNKVQKDIDDSDDDFALSDKKILEEAGVLELSYFENKEKDFLKKIIDDIVDSKLMPLNDYISLMNRLYKKN